jgi:hypothetical protein
MKRVRSSLLAIVGLLAFVPSLRAEDPPLTTPPDDDPNIRFDPDGIPLNLTQKKAQRATPDEIAAYRKKQQQAALDKDWMLRAYEQQLKTHAATSSQQDQNANPYQEVSANKDLAKLAGLQGYDADSDNSKLTYRLSTGSANHPAPALHPPVTPPKNTATPFGSSFIKPMITPLAGPDSSGLDSFFGTAKGVGTSTYSSANPAPQDAAPKPRASALKDDAAVPELESPGAIAAGRDALTDPATTELTLDVLPGESIEHAKAHQDNESSLQLPMVMDAEELHRQQAASLTPPVAKSADATATKNATAAATPAQEPLPDYHAPVPAAAFPVITPVHAPIGNPYDILNR